MRNLAEVRDSIEFHRLDIRDARDRAGDSRRGRGLSSGCAGFRAPVDRGPGAVARYQYQWHVQCPARGCERRRAARRSTPLRRPPMAIREVLPKTESMKPLPKSPYAVQKLLGEFYASVFTSCFGLETVSLRFFNVYGPRQDPSSQYSGVLSLFMKHCSRAPRRPFSAMANSRAISLTSTTSPACASKPPPRRTWPAKCTTPAMAAASR